MEPFVLMAVTLLAIMIHALLMKKPRTLKKLIDITFIYIMFIIVGLGGITAYIGHVFFGPEISKMIGWAPGSPFQYEVGVADLALGSVGLLVPWIRGTYWLGAALVNTIFLIGCSVGHIRDIVTKGNMAAYNAGATLYISDLAIPLIILALAIVSLKLKDKPAKKSKKTKRK